MYHATGTEYGRTYLIKLCCRATRQAHSFMHLPITNDNISCSQAAVWKRAGMTTISSGIIHRLACLARSSCACRIVLESEAATLTHQ